MSISIRGISSGIDINGIIEELMHVERQPIRRKEAMIERNEQINALWFEVNNMLNTLKRTTTPLLSELTYTAPVPKSSNTDVLTARVSGNPVAGSYRFNVSNLATRHTVATAPSALGYRIASANEALGYFGSFYLGTGNSAEGISALTFDEADTGWIRGNIGSGFQAVVDGNAGTVYQLNPEDVNFAAGYEDAVKINVYLDAFVNASGEDALDDLQAYLTGKGWPEVNLTEPLFTIEEESPGVWVAYNQAGPPHTFAFLGDHPLGTFKLQGNIVDADDNVLAVNDFDFAIRDSVDESGLITVKETDSLTVIAQKINNKSSQTGISATVVMAGDNDYRMLLESSVEGKSGYIQAFDYTPLDASGEIKYGVDTVLNNIYLIDSSATTGAGTIYREGAETIEAEDAHFTLNGLSMTRGSNTFRNAVEGVEITLVGSGSSTLEVAADIDAAVEEIRLFVEAFNEVNAYLRRLQENEKGPLQGSSDLMRVERQLRSIVHGLVPDIPGSSHFNEALNYSGSGGVKASASGVYTGSDTAITLIYNASAGVWRYSGETFNSGDTIDGVTITLAGGAPANNDRLTLQVSPPSEPLSYTGLGAIGIMADDKEGVLGIDEIKLRAALSNDPESVYRLFAREAPRDPNGRARGAHGVAGQLDLAIGNMIGFNGFVQNRQDYFNSQIKQYEQRIEMLERRMEMREQRLVRQFTFMEQHIARIQEQTGLMASFEIMMNQQNER